MRADFGSQKTSLLRNESVTPDMCCPGVLSAEQLSKHVNECLCEFKEVNEFDKSCISKVNDLMVTQKHLYDVVNDLEKREKESIDKLQQADCMWSCMEEAYKRKIEQANERQKLLLNKLKELEKNNSQWKKMKSDLELQINHVKNSEKEMLEKIGQRNIDFKIMENDIEGFKKRIEDGQKETEALQKSYDTKKKNMDTQIKYINDQIAEKTTAIAKEIQKKNEKEQEGNKMIMEAREDLQKSWKVLLQKRLENEDLKVEKETILNDINMLETINNECIAKCSDKQNEILKDIKDIDEKIKAFKVRCTHCHRSVDTEDVRIHCNDCPRCARQRECLQDGDTCVRDPAYECACMATKRRFMDNVFENMFIVLERYLKTNAGKAVGNVVVESLKHSKNGKLDKRTRKILQDFILTTIRKNLNLTIVGGAIKTRCEMDPETFKELMLCLQEIKVVEPTKEDKSTSKKPPCKRWQSNGIECNCYGGPNTCICSQRPPPSASPGAPNLKFDDDPEARCPDMDKTCGPDCGMHGQVTGQEIASWRPDPCKANTCNIANKNMRAAQCLLDPDYTINDSQEINLRELPHEKEFFDKYKNLPVNNASPIPSTAPKDTKGSVPKHFNIIYLNPDLSKEQINVPELTKNLELSFDDRNNKLFQEHREESFTDNPISSRISPNSVIKKDYSNSTFILKARIINHCKLVSHGSKSILNSNFNKKAARIPKVKFEPQTKFKIQKHSVRTETSLNQGKLLSNLTKKKPHCGKKTIEVLTCSVEPLKIHKSTSKEMPLYMKQLLSKYTEIDTNIYKNQSDTITSNEAKAFLEVTKSGYFTVHIDENYEQTRTCHNEDFYKIILKSEKGEIETPLILKQTTYNDFQLVIDKEYEHAYRDVIKHIIDSGDYITLRRRPSGSFIFNMEEVAPSDLQKEVVMIDLPLQGIQNTRHRYNVLKSVSFRDVMTKLDDIPISTPRVKGISDTKLYINAYKSALQNHKFIMSKCTVTIVNPGEYAVNFNGDMKTKFFDNLKELLRTSQDFSPLLFNTSTEIIIAILYKHDNDICKEVFKITSSGDVYLLKCENSSHSFPVRKTQSTATCSMCVCNLNKQDKAVATCSKVCGEKCDTSKCDCTGADKFGGKLKHSYQALKVYSSNIPQSHIDNKKEILSPKNDFSQNYNNNDISTEECLVDGYKVHDKEEVNIEEDIEIPSKAICFDCAPPSNFWGYIENLPPQLPPFLGCQWDLRPCKFKATT